MFRLLCNLDDATMAAGEQNKACIKRRRAPCQHTQAGMHFASGRSKQAMIVPDSWISA
jgi:hypothetical protein